MAFCAECGGQIGGTAAFCKHCGIDQRPFLGSSVGATRIPAEQTTAVPSGGGSPPGSDAKDIAADEVGRSAEPTGPIEGTEPAAVIDLADPAGTESDPPGASAVVAPDAAAVKPDLPGSAAPEPPSTRHQFCHACASPVRWSARFCDACGVEQRLPLSSAAAERPLSAPARATSAPPRPRAAARASAVGAERAANQGLEWLLPGRAIEDVARAGGYAVGLTLGAALLVALVLGAPVGIEPAGMLAAVMTLKVTGVGDTLGLAGVLALPITPLFALPSGALAACGLLTARRLGATTAVEAFRAGAASGVVWIGALLIVGAVWGGAKPNLLELATVGLLYGILFAGVGGVAGLAGRAGLRAYVAASAAERTGPVGGAFAGLLGALGPTVLAGVAATAAFYAVLFAIGLLLGDGTLVAGVGLLGLLAVLWFARPLASLAASHGHVRAAQALAATLAGAIVLLILQSEGLLAVAFVGGIAPIVAAVGAFLGLGGAFQVDVGLQELGGLVGQSRDLDGVRAALWAGGDGTNIAMAALVAGSLGALAVYRGLVYAGQLAATRARAVAARDAAAAGALIAVPTIAILLLARTMVRVVFGASAGGFFSGSITLAPSTVSLIVGGGIVSAALGALGGWRALSTGHAPVGAVSQLGYPKLLWWGAAPANRARDSLRFIARGLRGLPTDEPYQRPRRESVVAHSDSGGS